MVFDLPASHPLHISDEFRMPALGVFTLEEMSKAGKSLDDVIEELRIHELVLPPLKILDDR